MMKRGASMEVSQRRKTTALQDNGVCWYYGIQIRATYRTVFFYSLNLVQIAVANLTSIVKTFTIEKVLA